MSGAERTRRWRRARAAKEAALGSAVAVGDGDPATAFLRGVAARSDRLGTAAEAGDIRVGMEAGELLPRFEEAPGGDKNAMALARLLAMSPADGVQDEPTEARARALAAVAWASDLLMTGQARVQDLRVGIAACKRLLLSRPAVDAGAVGRRMGMILGGATSRPPENLLVARGATDQWSDE